MGTSGVTITHRNRESRSGSPDEPTPGGICVTLGIGIFAHNEERQLRATLDSLSKQDLLIEAAQHGVMLEISVVANGCSDRTGAIAEAACAEIFAEYPNVTTKVALLETAGKSNAWNEYVHYIASPQADHLCFMDADIAFVGEDSLRLMLETLQRSSAAHVSVDTILKDLFFFRNKTALQSISVAISELTRAGAPKLAGSLYILRAAVARRVWLPTGLLVEDGFLKALITTDRFTTPENSARIVRADGAAHTFEAERRILQIFRHEKRLATGTAQNILLFRFLREQITNGVAKDACELIREFNKTDPDWLGKLTQDGVKTQGWRMLPLELLGLPFKQLQELPLGQRSRHFLTCVLRSIFNGLALAGTYLDLRRGRLRW